MEHRLPHGLNLMEHIDIKGGGPSTATCPEPMEGFVVGVEAVKQLLVIIAIALHTTSTIPMPWCSPPPIRNRTTACQVASSTRTPSRNAFCTSFITISHFIFSCPSQMPAKHLLEWLQAGGSGGRGRDVGYRGEGERE